MLSIRPATSADLPATYRICLLTGDAGEDATHLHADPDLLGHVYVGPYIVGQPEHALVLADDAGVAGYCLAVPDTRAFEAWAETSWWPDLRRRYPMVDADTPDAELIRLIHEPPTAPEAVVMRYPAHLHIDLLARARGHGHGRALMEQQLAGLRRAGVSGAHLGVADTNANAIEFYRHLGFDEIARLESSFLMGIRLD